jgi:hypothetical protein
MPPLISEEAAAEQQMELNQKEKSIPNVITPEKLARTEKIRGNQGICFFHLF